MTFNSWEFILFYPVVLLLYFVLPKKARWPMLLVTSYFFYMCYQTELIVLIFGTTLVSWVMSNLIEKTENTKLKKLALAITLITSLGVLFFFKYFNFLADSVFDIAKYFGASISPVTLNLMLPVGISFYTFQTLSYVIDVYRGDIKTERNFFFYALFVSFFPQLVAGPIERPDNLVPQLKEVHVWDKDNAIRGAKYMLLGFFKKICVADLLAGFVNTVYNNPTEASGLGVIIATVMFAVQIYCDFSGYTDIATGCARIMGIKLMKNFDSPYSAMTIKEFWSRWHISLSTWFRDYLYIPLGGNRVKKYRYYINVLIVFLVSGLWHGAAFTFVIWGLIHGVYQIIGSMTIKGRNRLIEKVGLSVKSPLVVWVRRFNTFFLVLIAWLFFRANSMADVGVLFNKLFTGWNVSVADTFEQMGLDITLCVLAVFSVLSLFILDRMLVWGDAPDRSDVLVKNGAFVYISWAIILCWCLLLSKDMISTFIYFQF